MIKRGFVLISMFILLILAASFPVAAQDATPEAASAPPVCTAAELKQVLAQVNQINGKISDAAKAGDNAQTAKQLTTALLAWGDAYQSYFGGIYAAYPQCIDGVIVSATLGWVLSEQMTLSSAALLNVDQSDRDITKAITDLVTIQAKMETQTTSTFTTLGKSAASGTGIPTWLPACTTDQLNAASALDDLQQTWMEQVPALQTYLSDGTVDKTAYLALGKLVVDYDNLLNAGSWGCAELFLRISNYVYLFNDTYTAMNIGAAASSETDNADFAKLQTYFNNTIAGYITVLAPTPEATEASS